MTHLKGGTILNALDNGSDVIVSDVGKAIIGVHEIQPSPPRSTAVEELGLDRTMCYVMQVSEESEHAPYGFPGAFTISKSDSFSFVKLKIWRVFRRQFGKKNDFTSNHPFSGMNETAIAAYAIKNMVVALVDTLDDMKKCDFSDAVEVPSGDDGAFEDARNKEER